jgi:hypothetical protein
MRYSKFHTLINFLPQNTLGINDHDEKLKAVEKHIPSKKGGMILINLIFHFFKTFSHENYKNQNQRLHFNYSVVFSRDIYKLHQRR